MASTWTLTYNDFYYTNLAVLKDGTSAIMFDYNLLGKGYAYADTDTLPHAAVCTISLPAQQLWDSPNLFWFLTDMYCHHF